ncbi:MAG: tetratricopeptide repeat protein [Candidatus Omnitrophica bacterium]|jgi:tetratricopeptide (TPR) repeat protein|nr:tetratricopeptide repeat protein [Candidatus Omnitrophota bacterium]
MPKKLNKFLPFVLIICVGFVVYANSLHNSFVWDDYWNITNNNFIRSWKNLPLIFDKTYLASPESFVSSNSHHLGAGEISFRPVVTLSYFSDYAIWGLNPFGYHLSNLLLHIANASILYLLLAMFIQNKLIALAAALFFLAHPVNTEAVNVINFREDLLVFFFFAASLITYLKSCVLKEKKQKIAYLFSLAMFLLALFSKEMALTLPLVIMLYDALFVCQGDFLQAWRRFKSRYLGYACVLLFYFWIWGSLMPNPDRMVFYPAEGFLKNLFTALTIVGTYIQWVFLPLGIHNIVPDNSCLVVNNFIPEVLISLLLISCLFALAVKKYAYAKEESFSIFWFFIVLLPVYNILPVLNTIMGARFLYIPVAGVCLLLALWVFKFSSIQKSVSIGLTVIILFVFSLISFGRSTVYRNNISLWQEMIKFYPRCPSAHSDLGASFESAGLKDQAISEYQAAIKLEPRYTKAYFNLGNCYYKMNLFQQAFDEYKKGLSLVELKKNLVFLSTNLGAAFRAKGRDKEAEYFFQQAKD